MNVESRVPAIRTTMHPRIVRFRPMTSMSPAMNGAVAPNSIMLIEMVPEMVLTFHPKACCKGSIRADKDPGFLDFYLHQQVRDTSTPSDWMLGYFRF